MSPEKDTTTNTAENSSQDQSAKPKKTEEVPEEDSASDSDRDPTLPESRAWVSRKKTKQEVVPPSTFRSGERVYILVRGTARGSGTITRKQWSSSWGKWDYEVQGSDGSISWRSEDDLDPM